VIASRTGFKGILLVLLATAFNCACSKASDPADAARTEDGPVEKIGNDAVADDDVRGGADRQSRDDMGDMGSVADGKSELGGDTRRFEDTSGDIMADTGRSGDTSTDRGLETGPQADLPSDLPDTGAGDAPRLDGRDSGGALLGPVSVVADNVLSSNATTVKSYDTNVNVASYRQHGILYYEGYQFVAWYNGNTRNAIVARRSFDRAELKAGTWSWAYVDYVLSSDGDSHNVIVMGISPTDGRLHVAIGQHGSQLYYSRSVANAVSGTTWDNTVFGGTGTASSGAAAPTGGLPGYTAATNNVTYPYFMNAPDTGNTLQLAYRTGSSGDGEMQLAEYSTSSNNWTYIGQFTSASGSYIQNNVTSTTRNAYPHGLNYDEAGRLHMAYTWRENLNVAFIANCGDTINNHDTLYIYSDDHGRTWKNSQGTTVGDVKAKTSAGVASAGLVVDPLPVGRDMMNQETQITDHNNLFHAVISYVPTRYQATCATDRSQAQPFHLWRAADGTWTKTEIQLGGKDVNQGYDRSKIFVDEGDNVYVLMPDLRLVGASAASQWTDWQLLWDGRSRDNYGEVIIDFNLTRTAKGVSVLYMKDTNSTTGELHVLDLKIGQ
jgi:hypothetical protein